MKRYNPKEIEPKWQNNWEAEEIYKAVDFDKKPKFVMLTEFPYPSGVGIHLGHAREYTYGDMIARHKRMQGFNVLYPMGYDEFGLPTENFAIKNKVTPQSATEQNVATFQSQLEALGYGIDWSRKVRTSDPDYYKWTQWLFLQFFDKGLAYQDEIAINWCPFEKTGLANEEVINGRHERCGTLVEKKLLKQWSKSTGLAAARAPRSHGRSVTTKATPRTPSW
jgi:leucyl-tRNA synthetase